jgi:hypothetical protein
MVYLFGRNDEVLAKSEDCCARGAPVTGWMLAMIGVLLALAACQLLGLVLRRTRIRPLGPILSLSALLIELLLRAATMQSRSMAFSHSKMPIRRTLIRPLPAQQFSAP